MNKGFSSVYMDALWTIIYTIKSKNYRACNINVITVVILNRNEASDTINKGL